MKAITGPGWLWLAPVIPKLPWLAPFGTGLPYLAPVGPFLHCLAMLPRSAPSWILSYAENLASFSLQDGATEWHDYVRGTHPPTHPVPNLTY